MIFPKPLAHEFIQGLESRTRRLNGFESSEHLRVAMRSNALVKPTFCMAVLLAEACGLDSHAFVCRHTLAPVTRCIVTSEPDVPHGDLREPRAIQRASLAARGDAYLCIDCVTDDSKTGPISYWRRDHQFPGVDWCLDHRRPLHKASLRTFSLFPHEVVHQSAATGACSTELSNPIVRAYLEVVRLLTALGHRPLRSNRVRSLLGSVDSDGALIRLRNGAPSRWLTDNFSNAWLGRGTRPSMQPISVILCLVSQGRSIESMTERLSSYLSAPCQ